jgi:hypothetical protein
VSEAPPAGPDPLAVIGDLTAALEGTRTDLRSLRDKLESVRQDSEGRDALLARSARRSRQVITGLVISFCADLLVTAGFGWNTIRVNDAQDATRAIQVASHASEVSACEQANVNRAQDRAVFNQLLADLAPPPVRTPAVKAKLTVINRLIAAKDTPHDCAAVYRLP